MTTPGVRSITCPKHLLGLVAAVAVLVMAPVLAGCRGDDGDDDGVTTVRVTLGDWFVRPDAETVQTGPLAFEATNDGAVPHEFVVLRTGLHSDSLPLTGNRADVEAAGDVIGRIESIPPGDTRTGTFTLEPGRYVLLCNIDGHYQAGMHVDLEVTRSE